MVTLFPRAVVTSAALCFLSAIVYAQPADESPAAVLVQGSDLDAVIAAVCAVGGEITHELGIIDAVGARLTPDQARKLALNDETLRIHADRMAKVNSRQRITTGVKTASGGPARQGPCAKHDTGGERPSIDTGPAERPTGDSREAPR